MWGKPGLLPLIMEYGDHDKQMGQCAQVLPVIDKGSQDSHSVGSCDGPTQITGPFPRSNYHELVSGMDPP